MRINSKNRWLGHGKEKDVRVGRAFSAHADPMSRSGQFKNPSTNTLYPFVPFGRTIHCSRLVPFGRTPPNAYRAAYTYSVPFRSVRANTVMSDSFPGSAPIAQDNKLVYNSIQLSRYIYMLNWCTPIMNKYDRP
jgi:hypothetical protein